MRAVLITAGVIAFAFAAYMTRVIRSDIQIELLVTALIGGLVLIGLAAVLSQLKRLQTSLDELRKTEAAPSVRREPIM